MLDLDFLPSFPFEFNVVALFGILLGQNGLGLIDSSTLLKLRPLPDIALGVVLFEFGRRLDFKWWRQDRWLAVSSITESVLGFALVFGTLLYMGLPPLVSGMAAAIGISTSPGVLLDG